MFKCIIETSPLKPEDAGLNSFLLEDKGNIRIDKTLIPNKLPNSKELYYVIVQNCEKEDFPNLLKDNCKVISYSYEELYNSDYPYKDDIFVVNVSRRNSVSTFSNLPLPISAVVPCDFIPDRCAHPPVIWAGEEVPSYELSEELKKKIFLPQGYCIDKSSNHQIIFMCDGLGLLGTHHGEFEFENITWRYSGLYNPNHEIYFSLDSNPPIIPFTGAIEMNLPAMDSDKFFSEEGIKLTTERRELLYRILAALHLLTNANPKAFKEATRHGGGIRIQNLPNMNTLRFGPEINKPNVTIEEFQLAIKASRLEHTRGLIGGIVRALDAFSHARFSWDIRVAYILIWASIESLISPSQNDGISATVSLAILGAENLHRGKITVDKFYEIKESYSLRSKLVHDFTYESDDFIREHCHLSFGYLKHIFKAALEWVSTQDKKSRDDKGKFTKSLVNEFLVRVE